MKNNFLLAIIISLIALTTPAVLLAQDETNTTTDVGASLPKISNPLGNPELSVKIPSFVGFRNAECNDAECVVPWIADYIDGLYKYGIGIIGILAVIVLMIGGVMWLTAGGKEERIKEAKNMISGSLLGVVIAMSSFMILYIINPALTQLSPIKIAYIEKQDVEDLSEPIPEEEINKNPEKGKIELDKNKWEAVPNDKSGLAIWTAKSERSSPESIAALKKAAECFRKLNPQNNIKISDASRSQEEQKSLYQSNCCGGRCKCSPPTCNPYGGICPHTSGAAFDAWGCTGNSCKGEKRQKELQGCMIQAGFCLLSSECWHFEYPQISSSCGSTKHYTGKYCN